MTFYLHQHRQILGYFVVAILACSVCVSSAGSKNKNVLFGPMGEYKEEDNIQRAVCLIDQAVKHTTMSHFYVKIICETCYAKKFHS